METGSQDSLFLRKAWVAFCLKLSLYHLIAKMLKNDCTVDNPNLSSLCILSDHKHFMGCFWWRGGSFSAFGKMWLIFKSSCLIKTPFITVGFFQLTILC